MNWTMAVRTAIACVVLVILHHTLRPLLGWRAPIDFLIIALLFGAVRMRPGHAALYGLLLGLVGDSLSAGGIGASALGMTVVGFAAARLKAVFFADNLVLNTFFIFLGKWSFDLIVTLAMRSHPAGDLVMQLLVWSPLSAAVTAAAGAVSLVLLRPLMELRTA
jgi:rod shape-determining protein MreD